MARQVLVYKLKDDVGEILDGTFYEPELQKIIKNDDLYRVAKILRMRKRRSSGVSCEMERIRRPEI